MGKLVYNFSRVIRHNSAGLQHVFGSQLHSTVLELSSAVLGQNMLQNAHKLRSHSNIKLIPPHIPPPKEKGLHISFWGDPHVPCHFLSLGPLPIAEAARVSCSRKISRPAVAKWSRRASKIKLTGPARSCANLGAGSKLTPKRQPP